MKRKKMKTWSFEDIQLLGCTGQERDRTLALKMRSSGWPHATGPVQSHHTYIHSQTHSNSSKTNSATYPNKPDYVKFKNLIFVNLHINPNFKKKPNHVNPSKSVHVPSVKVLYAVGVNGWIMSSFFLNDLGFMDCQRRRQCDATWTFKMIPVEKTFITEYVKTQYIVFLFYT